MKKILIFIGIIVMGIFGFHYFQSNLLNCDMESVEEIAFLKNEYRVFLELDDNGRKELNEIIEKYDLTQEGSLNETTAFNSGMMFSIKKGNKGYYLFMAINYDLGSSEKFEKYIFELSEITDYDYMGDPVFGEIRKDGSTAINRYFESERLYKELENFAYKHTAPLPQLEMNDYTNVIPSTAILKGERRSTRKLDAQGKTELKKIINSYDLFTEGVTKSGAPYPSEIGRMIIVLDQKPYLLTLFPNNKDLRNLGFPHLLSIREILMFDTEGKPVLRPYINKADDRMFSSENLHKQLEDFLYKHSRFKEKWIIPLD